MEWGILYLSALKKNLVIQFQPENIVSFYLNEFFLSGGTPIKMGRK